MIGSGLWTACKESRRVIRKHFANPSNNPCGLPKRGIVSYCSGSNPFYLSIWPGSDLIVLQPDNFFNTDWRYVAALAYTPGPSQYPLKSCREIGIEYDTEWADRMWVHDVSSGSRDISLAPAGLLLFFQRRRLWLVDKNLKRKAGASSSYDSEAMQFYANDRKFVQVSLEKGQNNLREWEYMHPVAGRDYRESSIYFAISANEMTREVRIRLLGWEELKKS
jgi:hypothetical protein